MKRDKLRWLTARPIAHRGFHDRSQGRPENSLAAFDAAVKARYAIECDLHLAADGVPVVFHDDTLDRLTGEAGEVRDRTSAELGNLRLLGTGERMPKLQELLGTVAGRVPLVIELKSLPGRDAGFAHSVVRCLNDYDGPASLMSFDAALIEDVKAAAPEFPRGYTAEGDRRRAAEHFRTIRRVGVDFISYSIDDLPTPLPLLAKKLLGIPLICWTVRRPDQVKKAARWADQITFEGFSP